MHKDFLEQLGRTGEIAKQIGVASQTVSKWKVRAIPWRYRAKFVRMAALAGVQLPEGFLDE